MAKQVGGHAIQYWNKNIQHSQEPEHLFIKINTSILTLNIPIPIPIPIPCWQRLYHRTQCFLQEYNMYSNLRAKHAIDRKPHIYVDQALILSAWALWQGMSNLAELISRRNSGCRGSSKCPMCPRNTLLSESLVLPRIFNFVVFSLQVVNAGVLNLNLVSPCIPVVFRCFWGLNAVTSITS